LNGPGPYHGEAGVIHSRHGARILLQGPDAKQIKFDGVLCTPCNNTRTQPFDEAYEQFHEYALANESLIVQRRVIDFCDVYKTDFFDQQLNLYRYFAKLFGCYVSQYGFQVPDDIRVLLDRPYFLTKFRVTFAVNEDVLLFGPDFPQAGLDPFGTTQRNIDTRCEPDPMYWWGIYFTSIHICFWYNCVSAGPTGAPWTGDSRFIYLGRITPFDEEMREKIKANPMPRGDIGTS
jgi:hypothetical protein